MGEYHRSPRRSISFTPSKNTPEEEALSTNDDHYGITIHGYYALGERVVIVRTITTCMYDKKLYVFYEIDCPLERGKLYPMEIEHFVRQCSIVIVKR